MKIRTTTALAGLAVASAASMTACADDADASTITATMSDSSVNVPEDALTYAAEVGAGTTCGAVNTDLIVGTIAATTGYDTDYSDESGGAGWSGLAPAAWDQYTTADDTDRADGRAATQAVANKLCDAYRTAAEIHDKDRKATVDDLALSVYLVGESYTQRYGVVPDDADWDPHQVREKITRITDAADSVRRDI